jgi:lysophospholipase L1-like esterase
MSLFKLFEKDSVDIVFIGDSHIEMCNWADMFNNDCVRNMGIHGNVLEGVIDEVKYLPYCKDVVLMVGINDLRSHKNVSLLVEQYDTLTKLLKRRNPNIQITINSILPMSSQLNVFDSKILSTNDQLMELCERNNFHFINLYPLFVEKDNDLNSEYTFDGLHLNGKGYMLWSEILNERK